MTRIPVFLFPKILNPVRETRSLLFAVTWPDIILYTVSNDRLLITDLHTVIVVGPVCELSEKGKGVGRVLASPPGTLAI